MSTKYDIRGYIKIHSFVNYVDDKYQIGKKNALEEGDDNSMLSGTYVRKRR